MQAQTVNISLPKNLIKIMDDFAKSQFSSRSDLIRTAVVRYINEDKNLNDLYMYFENKARKLKLKEEDIEEIIDEYRQEK